MNAPPLWQVFSSVRAKARGASRSIYKPQWGSEHITNVIAAAVRLSFTICTVLAIAYVLFGGMITTLLYGN